MKVKIVALGPMQDSLGFRTKQIDFDGHTLGALLASVGVGSGATLRDFLWEAHSFKPTYIVAVNGIDARTLGGLDTRLSELDNVVLVHISPVAAGG